MTAGRGFSGRLKPCYRHFRWQAWPNYRLPRTVEPPAAPPSKRRKSSKVDKTSTSHCDSPVQQTDCFKKPQSPLKKGGEEKEEGEGEEVRKVIRPVRKFASNDVLARYVEEYGKPQQEEVGSDEKPPPPAKKVRANNPVDLPMFCLSGLVESRPIEAEGWFVNKISQLKRVVAEATAAYKATTGADDVAKQSSKRGRPSTGSSKESSLSILEQNHNLLRAGMFLLKMGQVAMLDRFFLAHLCHLLVKGSFYIKILFKNRVWI